jgi:hypothetical protein
MHSAYQLQPSLLAAWTAGWKCIKLQASILRPQSCVGPLKGSVENED